MAYALRYYKEIAQADGSACRLEIYKKDSTASAIEIGAVVQGLSLEIQGQQGDVDSPIVKTSLSMTFVDAGDLENGQKNGFWEEFYTPDALMWKVVLKVKDAQETAFRTMWGGYVTPDSFSENIVYRGSVTIIARDNIGHMQDFPFDAQGDADGLISLYNLVNMAWEKIQSPMDLEWNPNQMMVCDGVPAYDTLMNVSQFEGMDWYKAVESALASYGMVMRFVGDNAVHIGALRFLPNLGWVSADSVPHMEPRFISGATRELVPAVRRIEESVDYEAGEVNAPQVDSSDFTGDINSTLLTTSTGVLFRLYSWDINNTEEGEGWVDNGVSAPYFNPEGYDMTELVESDSHDGRFMWLAFSQYITGDNRYALYSRRMMAGRIAVRFAFGPTYRLVNSKITPIGSARADYAVVAIEVVSGSSRYFLQEDGTWGSALDMLTYRGEQMQDGELVLDLPTDEFDGGVILNVRIYEAGYYSWSQDSYVPLYALSFTANNVMMEKNSVNTIYNTDNNVILSRSPEIGPAYDRVSFPGFIKNGIFLRDGDEILPAKKWGWSGGTMQQMAVFNHLQLLSYFAKPNNLISGTIVNADITRVSVLYEWHGAEHMLMSGRYNFLNGFIENAVLREFARYEDMWSEVAGAALPETEEEGTTNVESGSSSGGSSPTYTNATTVNIGTGGSGGGGASYLGDLGDVDVAGVVAQSVLYYNGTSWVDMTLSSLLNPFLNPYIKASDVEAALALKADASALEALGQRVTADENNIATLTNNKADKATTLAGYGIKDAYTKTEVDGKVTTINNSITAVSGRVTTIETWKTELSKYITIVDGNVKISTNLIVTGDSSSGESGEDTPAIGTVTGIKVNGQTYNPTAGIVTIPDYPTTLEWNAIGGKPSFAAVATSGKYSDLSGLPTIPSLDGYATEKWVTDKGYATATALSSGLSTKVDKVSGKGLSTNDFTTTLLNKLNGIASGAQVNVQSDWNATSGDAFIKNKPTIPAVPTKVSAFTNDAGYITASALDGYATESWVEGKKYLTAHQEVKNTGNTLSFGSAIIIGSVGGTNLTAALPSVASVKTSLGLGSLAYLNSLSKSDVGLGNVENTALSTWAGTNKITTLGTITSGIWNGSKIANAYLVNSAITIAGTSVSLGGSIAASTITAAQIGSGNTLIHSGNIGSQSVNYATSAGNANTLRGYGLSSISYSRRVFYKSDYEHYVVLLCKVGTNTTNTLHRITGKLYTTEVGFSRYQAADIDVVVSDWTSGNNSYFRFDTYGMGTRMRLITCTYEGSTYLAIEHTNTQAVYLYFEGTLTNMDLTAVHYYSSNTETVVNSEIYNSRVAVSLSQPYSGSYKYALTSDNVASATKLATARTIWGQSFDGTGNVTGSLNLYTVPAGYTSGWASEVNVKNSEGTALTAFGAYGYAQTLSYAYIGPSYLSPHVVINSSGNVTIGGGDLAGTDYKLFVHGNTKFISDANSLKLYTRINGSVIQVGRTTANYTSGYNGGLTYGEDDNVLGYIAGVYNNKDANNTHFFYGGPAGSAVLNIKNGNVLIGTTTDSGYKLDVNGTARVSGAVTMSSTLSVAGGVSTPALYGGTSGSYNWRLISDVSTNAIWLQAGLTDNTSNSGVLYLSGINTLLLTYLHLYATETIARTLRPSSTGTYTLGTSSYRWSTIYGVNGDFSGSITCGSDLNVGGNAIIAGDTSNGSDIRFKDVIESKHIKIDDIANAPLFTFKWNDREDDTIHLGTSAQYWEGVAPWLVKGEDFKTLDYATLGVAIGISLANKTMNLDDRVKILEDENKALKAEINRLRRHDN